MEVTTLVAIYAAVVATAAVLVQLAVWRSTRTQVRLRVNPGTGPVQGESDGAGGVYTKEADVVFIEITNRSGHLVKISQVWAVRADNPERSFVFPWPYPTHQRLPLEIPARDSRNVWVLQEGLETDVPLRFVARTTAGDEFRTKPIVVDDQPQLSYAVLGDDAE